MKRENGKSRLLYRLMASGLSLAMISTSVGIVQASAVLAAENDSNAEGNKIALESGDAEPLEFNAVPQLALKYKVNSTDIEPISVNGNQQAVLQYNPANKDYSIQVGGTLNLQPVWSIYRLAKNMYITLVSKLGGVSKDTALGYFKNRVITGTLTYSIPINSEKIIVDPSKGNKEDWQEAFKNGSQSKTTDGFFSFMKCYGVDYSHGKASVTFKVFDPTNPNMEGVTAAYLEANSPATMPSSIEAFSPEGLFTIPQNKFTDGAVAIDGGNATFDGKLETLGGKVSVDINVNSKTESYPLVLKGAPSTGGGSGSGGGTTNPPASGGGNTSTTQGVDLYRLYNPNSGEHFYTQNKAEQEMLVSKGWKPEGIGWTSPTSSQYPVYRLYNPNAGDHHFTQNANEKDILSTVGWQYEGISWYSLPPEQGVKVYREYNPNAKMAGAHNYTKSKEENDYLISIGWLDEGVAWWALK